VKNLLVQSIGTPLDPSRPDAFEKYMDLALPIHEDYAARCDADYEYFVGWKEERVNPTWNRLPMILEAFERGYESVVWMDADVLVVKPDRDIFAEVVGAPLHMTRTSGFPYWTPAGEQEAWNDGVLVAHNTPEAIDALRWTWDRRHDPFLEHQVAGMPELTWLLDYVFTHPDGLVAELPDIWNWMDAGVNGTPRDDAVIEAFHGQRHHERWDNYRDCYQRAYGA
jgi:hypothetical protein